MRNLLLLLFLALALYGYTAWQGHDMDGKAMEVSQGRIVMFSTQW